MIDIRQGDCLELLKTIPDNSVDMVLTDPPYVVDLKGGGIVSKRDFIKNIRTMSNGFDFAVLDELCRVMKKINIYIFCSKNQLIPLLDYFVTDKGCYYNLLTWNKTNPVPACGNSYLPDTEYILFFREKGVRIYGSYATKFTYYQSPTNTKESKLYQHPTVKPQALLDRFIKNSSKENELILDCFMGSGSTGVACINTNRNFIGFELDERYFEVAKKRINDALCDR